MVNKAILLECPRAVTGNDVIRHEMPNRLPESKRAVQAGKLPRKAGLVVVHKGDQFEFNLQAESFAVGSAKLPKLEGTPRAIQEGHVDQLRELIATIDALYKAFLDVRVNRWKPVLTNIQNWLEGS